MSSDEKPSTSSKIIEYYNYVFTDLSDPRTNHWPLISSPIPGLCLLAVYLLFCTRIGPKLMANRKPFNLNNILIAYNAIQVLISIWIVYEALDGVWLTKYSVFRCEPVSWDVTPLNMRICRGFYIYFIAKLTELLDTVFFVLRKKHNQVTFLHLYHHTTMPMVSWGATKYYPGGHGSFIGLVNSFVHIIMYFYYMVAAMGPKYQRFLWWKKYLTILQLIQFCMTFCHSMLILFSKDCTYPKWSVCIVLPNTVFFYLLFTDFYKKSYQEAADRKQAAIDAQKLKDSEANGKLTNGSTNGKISNGSTVSNAMLSNGQDCADRKKTD